MGLEIILPGPLTTVQDSGRAGYGDRGIGKAGAADLKSLRIANILVGNDMDEAGLECTLTGPEIRFHRTECIAICGADMSPEVDGRKVPMNQCICVHVGQTLKLGMALKGLRTYIAFAGGLDIPYVYGSKSTDLRCSLGGYYGKSLSAGDGIAFLSPVSVFADAQRRRYRESPAASDKIEIRVIKGSQYAMFTRRGIETFTSQTYQVTSESNRQACKLSGTAIETASGYDIISDGIMEGSIQVSASGMPMVMLADHQTTGGYAKIGTVITADIPKLAQCRPGDSICFRFVPLFLAEREYKKEIRLLQRLKDSFRR